MTHSRRGFLGAAAGSVAALSLPRLAHAAGAPEAIQAEIVKRHDEGVLRLQQWIREPAIAAENRGMDAGCETMLRLAREAGFQSAVKVPTAGHPGVFATLDAGAPRTLGLYFMYDVKQVDPAEWSSPPFDATLVDKPDFGKVVIGRGAVNQKGPQAALLAALHAIRGAGQKLPVNLVLVAEGEEEIGSPHFGDVMKRPEVSQALSRCNGVFMPFAAQDADGTVTVNLGAKGVVELELVASGAKWGRGPGKDVHSSNRARLDSPGVPSGPGARHAGDARGRSGDRRLRRRRAQADRRRRPRCSTRRPRGSTRRRPSACSRRRAGATTAPGAWRSSAWRSRRP
jgi:hypothetical protein